MVYVFATPSSLLPNLSLVSSCFIPTAIIRDLIIEAERWFPDETGGVLLGVADDANVWVEMAIGPGPNALHNKSGFVPDAVYQETQIASAYEQSGRRISYLGDWHTHPEQSVLMSKRDRRTLRSIGQWAASRQPRPIMAVLGGVDQWELAVYRYRNERARWWKRRPLDRLRTIQLE